MHSILLFASLGLALAVGLWLHRCDARVMATPRRFDPIVDGLPAAVISAGYGLLVAVTGRPALAGLAMAGAGADIIDVGGESTRPGAEAVSPDEEIRRVVPVIRDLAERGLCVSVDTRHAAVMAAALAAGARIVNDIAALADPGAVAVVRDAGAAAVLMHMQGEPRTMQSAPSYAYAPLDVYDGLKGRLEACLAAGIRRENLCVDPGIGFGKTLEHNLSILRWLALYRALGVPVLLGASRKRLIAAACGDVPPKARLPGSLAIALAGVHAGVNIVRVHDVAETVQAIRMQEAVDHAE